MATHEWAAKRPYRCPCMRRTRACVQRCPTCATRGSRSGPIETGRVGEGVHSSGCWLAHLDILGRDWLLSLHNLLGAARGGCSAGGTHIRQVRCSS